MGLRLALLSLLLLAGCVNGVDPDDVPPPCVLHIAISLDPTGAIQADSISAQGCTVTRPKR